MDVNLLLIVFWVIGFFSQHECLREIEQEGSFLQVGDELLKVVLLGELAMKSEALQKE